MKYYIDTEFIEGLKPLRIFGIKIPFIEPVFTIQLISIGIVAEDGRRYYAVSEEYCYKDASDWVKKNVIMPIYRKEVSGDQRQYFNDKNFHKYFGKTNKQISDEIIKFVNPNTEELVYDYTRHDCWVEQYYPQHFKYIKEHNVFMPKSYYKSGIDSSGYAKNAKLIYAQPEFYGYYADYDWVVFCSLFGTMMNLPKGFPMYCKDLKQMLDEKALSKKVFTKEEGFPPSEERTGKDIGIDKVLSLIKSMPGFPKQDNEHDAIDDAEWNKKLAEFIHSL